MTALDPSGTLIVPPLDEEPWPSLGGQVCDFIEERAVYGPGSLKGQPAKLSAEKRAIIWRAYELYPAGHEFAGRRRFKRVRISWRKGVAKTEFGAWLVYAELHPEGPVRFDGWDAYGQPVGRPVTDPYVPMLAYEKEQVAELSYGVLKLICEEGPDADLFDVSLERILRLDYRGRPDGKAVPLSGAPNARDGARTTMQYYDETHRLYAPGHIAAVTTMEANLPKRPLDDPWSLGTTTAGRPGQDSVAETDKLEAENIASGKITEPQVFYFHRQTSDSLAQKAQKSTLRAAKSGKAEDKAAALADRIAAVAEATGPEGEYGPGQFRDIALQWDKPKADIAYLERTWWNRWNQGGNMAFDITRWRENAVETGLPAPRTAITLGLDGARWRDMAAVIATVVDTGMQFPIGMWDPKEYEDGIPPAEVKAAVLEATKRYRMLRCYGDPAMGWDVVLAELSGELGPKRVVHFYTDARNLRGTANMCRSYAAAIRAGEVTNNGDPEFERHIGAAYKRDIRMVDDDGTPLWVMSKERPDSPNRIDAAMAGGLSWLARLDAIAANDQGKGGLTRVRGTVRAY